MEHFSTLLQSKIRDEADAMAPQRKMNLSLANQTEGGR